MTSGMALLLTDDQVMECRARIRAVAEEQFATRGLAIARAASAPEGVLLPYDLAAQRTGSVDRRHRQTAKLKREREDAPLCPPVN